MRPFFTSRAANLYVRLTALPRVQPLSRSHLHLSRRLLASTSPQRSSHVQLEAEPDKPWDVRKWSPATQAAAGLVICGLGYYLYHLEQVPETGRWRFMDIDPKYEAELADSARKEVLEKYGDRILSPDHILSRHVRRIVSQLLEANDLGSLSSDVESIPEGEWVTTDGDFTESSTTRRNVKWNVYVVNDGQTVNASAAVGTIVVFTGLLPICKDEHGLAAVLAHEIGHAVARHTAEDYSSIKVFLTLALLLEALGLTSGFSKEIVKLFYSLPNSRKNELEADHLGLKIAARACFNPGAALLVQLRLMKARLKEPIVFLSTHPATKQRLDALMKLLPEAFEMHANSPVCSGTQQSVAAFQAAFEQMTLPESESSTDAEEESWLQYRPSSYAPVCA